MNQDKKMGQHSGRKSDSTGVVKRLGRHTVWGAMFLFVFFNHWPSVGRELSVDF